MSNETDRVSISGGDHGDALALRARDAARALGIGERKLWELTNSSEIPHARIGRAVVYPVRALMEWLAAKTVGQVA